MSEEQLENDIQAESLADEPMLTQSIGEDAPTSEDILPEEVSLDNEKESLLSEIERLKQQLYEKEQESQRILQELGEFSRLFPDISVRAVPKEVWKQVEGGIPLCAAYALYEREESIIRSKANETNNKNAHLSAGRAGVDTSAEYFSPEDVRGMSQKQVHENYSKIKNSMKYWR